MYYDFIGVHIMSQQGYMYYTLQGCIVHLGHRAMARPIIEAISRVSARELVMSRVPGARFWPTVVNLRMRTRDY